LAFAAVAAAGAAMLAGRSQPGNHAMPLDSPAATVDVLVAARQIIAGETVGPGDVRWQPWPRQALVAGSIERTAAAEAGAAFEPAAARYPILAGEPVVEAKLLRPGSGGVMASLVAAGMRAVSVPIREETAVGGFVQPQDRVDVLLTRRSREGKAGKTAAEVLLKSARVLAIGRALTGKGRAGAQHRTATLELTPAQARRIAGAQGAGDISLALVAAADNGVDAQAWEDDGAGADFEQPVRTMKFGLRSARTPY
jgi:pilus assembly protein CpaB